MSEHHLAAVERSSYRWVEHYSENWTSGNTTYTITSHRRAVVENETVYLVDASFSEPGQFRQGPAIADFGVRRFGDQTDGYSTYADGDDEYVSRTRSDNRTVQTVREPTGRTTYDTLAIRPIESYLDPHSLDVDVLRLRNQDYLVTSDRPATPLARAVENYSARAIVRSDGFVRSLNVTFDVTPGEHTRTVHYRFSYSDVGVASVDPPVWVREARDESPGG